MMTKADHIAYWKKGAEEDMDTARYIMSGGKYVPALFFFHLATEKLLKALWVKANMGNTPPFTHDLQKLSVATGLQWSVAYYDLLAVINRWNIEARYPDYKLALHRTATVQYLQHYQHLIESLHQWLLSNL